MANKQMSIFRGYLGITWTEIVQYRASERVKFFKNNEI